MPAAYQFTTEQHAGYLHARAAGQRTPENTRRFLHETYVACVEAGRDAVLLEVLFEGPSLDMQSIFEVIIRGSPDALKMRKIAYVDKTTPDPSRARFAETVAVNRGVNVRLFSDVGEAGRWLADDPG